MPNYILTEDGRLINADLITDVRFVDREKNAYCYCSGILIVADSAAAYDYFKKIVDSIPPPVPEK